QTASLLHPWLPASSFPKVWQGGKVVRSVVQVQSNPEVKMAGVLCQPPKSWQRTTWSFRHSGSRAWRGCFPPRPDPLARGGERRHGAQLRFSIFAHLFIIPIFHAVAVGSGLNDDSLTSNTDF